MALVSAVIPTRGDVPLDEILDSLPREWEKIVVDNSREPQDYSVYARYIGCQRASHDLIMTQDDDVIVSDPEALVAEWIECAADSRTHERGDSLEHVVCNMPEEFRHDFYRDHSLVGFGAVFHRDAPQRAFTAFHHDKLKRLGGLCRTPVEQCEYNDRFRRCCDIAFTALTPRVLVDVPKRNLPWCDAPNRMWKQPEHSGERAEFLRQVLAVRDA